MDYKANVWNECLKQNVFSNCREDELPRIQELFEQTLEESKDIDEIISVLRVKIQQISYKDLIPSEKQSMIDFSDNIEEEPLKDLDKLIAEKQKERQNDEPKNIALPQGLNTQVVTPQGINPQVVTPQAINPQVVTPQVVTPQGINPQAINPQVVTPQVVTPQVVTSNELLEIKKMVLQQNLILEQILESQIKLLRQKK